MFTDLFIKFVGFMQSDSLENVSFVQTSRVWGLIHTQFYQQHKLYIKILPNFVLVSLRHFYFHFITSIKEVLQTLSNIKDRSYCKNSQRLNPVNCFPKMVHLRCLIGFWIRLEFLPQTWRNWAWTRTNSCEHRFIDYMLN